MSFESIRAIGFRNLVDSEIDTNARTVFLVGENGQGKTNFLEAVYFCAFGSSFRGSKDSDIVRTGADACSLKGTLKNAPYSEVLVRVQNSKKQIILDSKPIVDRKILLDITPAIVFCHEDMSYVSGTPEQRRWFFDQSLSLYDSLYLEDLRKFRKILKTRNNLLKEKNLGMIDILDQQFVDSGIELMKKREAAAKLFTSVFNPLYEEIACIDDVSVRYNASWKTFEPDKIRETLIARRELDLNFGTSMSGPHRDRYQFIRKGNDFSSRASMGQRRLLALLLRISQATRFKQVTGKAPVLLLDDVLLELDPKKKKNFINILPAYEQAIFTFLPGEDIHAFKSEDSLVYTVSEGCIRK